MLSRFFRKPKGPTADAPGHAPEPAHVDGGVDMRWRPGTRFPIPDWEAMGAATAEADKSFLDRYYATAARQWLDEGKLHPIAFVNLYSPPSAYAEWVDLSKQTGIPVLDRQLRQNGEPNYNHWSFIETSKLRMKDNRVYLAERREQTDRRRFTLGLFSDLGDPHTVRTIADPIFGGISAFIFPDKGDPAQIGPGRFSPGAMEQVLRADINSLPHYAGTCGG